ncbi:unnamed protein product [Ambrosiozyma monospora]|uniref:Unnamed protein product n=1 Tax=Ambrosiozyma monospora TaxID=43982 RepID=A0ACB5U4R8_AMBMO|nr:unnamed protein product [Ambrosiozyma monospora]
MKNSILLTVLSCLTYFTDAHPYYNLKKKDETSDGFIKLVGHKTYGGNSSCVAGDYLKRRDGSTDMIEYDLEYQRYFYSVDVQIGSNGDNVTLLVDTGSSDMWVMSSAMNGRCNTASSSNLDSECDFGTFNYNESSSFHNNETDFKISYNDVKLVF